MLIDVSAVGFADGSLSRYLGGCSKQSLLLLALKSSLGLIPDVSLGVCLGHCTA